MYYLRQIWYELRERPLLTWVTISGTALSLFLVMAVFMVNRASLASMAPETDRDRIMAGMYIEVKMQDGSGSGSIAPDLAHRLYDSIPGVEQLSYYINWMVPLDVNLPGEDLYSLSTKKVDAGFWKVFDFDFISGKPFTDSEVKAEKKPAVLTESTARRLGGGANLIGRDVMIEHVPYRVTGIVKDPHPMLDNSWAKVYVGWEEKASESYYPEMGETSVFLRLSPGVTHQSIKDVVKHRYDLYNLSIAKEGRQLVYHNLPFTQEETINNNGSNNDPDSKTPNRKRYLLYLILLLLPAINLSGLTRSRMQSRQSEIGVRRAFGASRKRVISQLIAENFLVTIIGGMIGLLLSMGFIVFFSSLFIDFYKYDFFNQRDASPVFSMVFSWSAFGFALLFCFVLNLLSSGIPAFKATSQSPGDAISGR